MARLVVSAVVGVAVGYFLGPQAGLQAFALTYGVSGFLDPTKHVLGPKLNDLKAPSATYGAPISYIEGSPRLAGNYIYASEKREIVTTETQGKGGPGVDSTTFTYEIDVLILLAINRVGGIRRVFSNGKLVWSNADDGDEETFTASAITTSWRDMRFYDGNPDQLPDPTYEAAVGIGNAPAYRGRSTVFIEGLNLGASGQLPILTFEVGSTGIGRDVTFADVTSPTNLDSQGQGSTPFGLSGFRVHIGQWEDAFTDQVLVYELSASGEFLGELWVYNVATSPVSLEPTGHGQTDVDGILRRDAANGNYNDVYWYEGGEGVGHQFLTTGGVAGADGNTRFCMLGDVLIVGSANASASKKMFRFSKIAGLAAFPGGAGGGAPADVVSATLAHEVGSICTDGSSVWANYFGTDDIVELDVATLTVQTTITAPSSPTTNSTILCDEHGTLHYLDDLSNSLWSWDGAAWTVVLTGITAFANGLTQWGLVGGVLFAMNKVGAPANTERIHTFYPTMEQTVVPLDEVVSRLCLRTGLLTAGDIDVTALASDTVRAMAISQVSTMRSAIELLMGAYLFECVEGEKLTFVKRGGASVLTIPYLDLGANASGASEPLPKRRLNDVEIAARISVRYANMLNDFQDGLEFAERLVTGSTAEQVVELPLGFLPSEAKKLADANTLDAAVSLLQVGPIALPRKYAALEPTDVVTVVDGDGSSFRCRIIKGTIGVGIYSFDLVLDDATVINSAALTDDSYVSSTLVRLLADTQLLLLDIPILRDADNSPGFYGAFGAVGAWPGAELDKSADDISYSKILDIAERATKGTASTVLADYTGVGFDEVNTLTVDVGDGTLSSSTRDGLITSNKTNALLVGSEIIQFVTASLLAPGVYLLSGFFRGLRGTEWAIAGHVSAERVVLLQTTGIRRISETAADIGVPFYWKAVTHGKSRALATAQLFTDTGIALKPFAPVDLRADYSSSSIVFSWHRRSRLASRFLATVEPPLGEASEQYDVELRDASDVLQASATVTEPSYTAPGLSAGDFIAPSIWGMKVITGTRVAIRQDAPQLANSAPATSAESILALASDGTIAEQSPTLENIVTQWTNNGADVYVAGYRLTNTIPNAYVSSSVKRLTLGGLASVTASADSVTPGDWFGVAFDGTDVWVSEQLSNNVRRLNASSLASIASYAMTGSPGPMQYASGKLYVVCQSTGELVRFDTTSHTEDYRVTAVASAFDVLVVGSVVFVMGGSSVGAYNAGTGALITSTSFSPGSYLPGRHMVTFGSDIVIGTPTRVVFLDATTGLQSNTVSPPVSILDYAAGSVGSDLYLTGRSGSGFSEQTRIYEVATPNLAGYSITVWQKSATVGRGYPVTLEI